MAVLTFPSEGRGQMNVTIPNALLLNEVQFLCLADDFQNDLKLLWAQSLHLPLLLSLERVH